MTRYFDKVSQCEWIPLFHGDPAGNPNVVVLPPESTFWGEPMEPGEVMTYDVDGLPLARVPRTVAPEEALVNLLLDAGITKAAMGKALYLSGRGTTGPLTIIDNALDALALAQGVTLEALVELI